MNISEELLSKELSRGDLVGLLSIKDENDRKKLFDLAYRVKREYVGNKVYFRGIIELSNICEKNCYYCGIRKGNSSVERYILSENEIIEEALASYKWNYGSIVLQSGEVTGENYISFIERIIRRIKHETNNALGITLSLGEQSEEIYQRWFDAGAHRYLLRIESSNPKIYASLHPEDHSYEKRIECLDALGRIGYYVGTGVMIGLPGQTAEDLADDILFYKKIDADMIGMGPYIPHHDTPMADSFGDFEKKKNEQLDQALSMIAVTRIFLKDVNIASTTALQALDESGREKGLMAGANIIMPNLTETKYRRGYQLYDNKPCLDESATLCRGCLDTRIASLGETVGYGEWGDSPHYRKRNSS
jgi:biotin synthase